MSRLSSAIQALTGAAADWELDASAEFQSVYEADAWAVARATDPSATRWLIPQAPLDLLAGFDKASSWVDFLYSSPWNNADHVIEIDPDHTSQMGADRGRDALLDERGIPVHRIQGHELAAADRTDEFLQCTKWNTQ